MSYHVLDPQSLSRTPEYPCDRRSISDAVGLANLAGAVYELAPGDQLPRTYHYHEQREELFFVLAGELHVETPDEVYVVEEGSVFVVEPRNPHRGFVPDDAKEPARVLGVGSPRADPGLPADGE